MSASMLHALLGGSLIGISAVILMGGLGRIAGVTGILGSLLSPRIQAYWRYCFMLGLVLGGVLFQCLGMDNLPTQLPLPTFAIIVAGLLVGFGTTIGSGCTSGHGVCGLGRLSPRSLVATSVFLSVAMLTTYLTRHVWSLLP